MIFIIIRLFVGPLSLDGIDMMLKIILLIQEAEKMVHSILKV